jgi:urease subunit beta
VTPGEVTGPDGSFTLSTAGVAIAIDVINTGDRPIQVGSHYHFGEANPALSFDRDVARGYRLDIPAGTSVRFEPGIVRPVSLIPLGGARVVAGLRGQVGGPLDATVTSTQQAERR